MGRKPKVNKEVKIQACKDYLDGKGTFKSIANSIGVGDDSLRMWVYAFQMHGDNVFDIKESNRSYSKKFKLQNTIYLILWY